MRGYFDYAAATPVDTKVLQAMQPYFTEQFYNPSALYKPAREVKKALESARGEVATSLGVRPAEITFMAGGTEANNLAIHGIMQQYPKANVVISAIEHDSVRVAARQYDARECPVLPNGLINLEAFAKLIDDQTVLVSIILANNEIGTIQPMRRVSQIVQEIRVARQKKGNELPLYIHTDAAQALNYLDVYPHRLGVDLLSLNGGKIYGPKQSGALYVSGGVVLKPIIDGGGQERGLRSGTENVAFAIGLAKSLVETSACRESEAKRLATLQQEFIGLLKDKIPNIQINGSLKNRLPNNIHITIPDQDNERLIILLDNQGIYAAVGSACSASHDEPSHVLQAIGLDEATIRGSLRFTMGRFTDESDIHRAAQALATILA